jgi:hypothetical protein
VKGECAPVVKGETVKGGGRREGGRREEAGREEGYYYRGKSPTTEAKETYYRGKRDPL